MRKREIKAVLFDMDGVLIDAKEWHYEALNRALGTFGVHISRSEHLTVFDGLPTHKKLEMLSASGRLPRQAHKRVNELKQKYTRDLINSKCKPNAIHEYALSQLKKKGYSIAVCSNSIRESVEVMMEKANLTQYLDLMLSNQDVSKSKPDPEIYEKAMQFFNLHPQACLIIEDNENGIKSAKAAGGHLLVVESVHDVSLDNIMRRIEEIEQ